MFEALSLGLTLNSSGAGASGASRFLYGDRAPYTRGPYLAFASPWAVFLPGNRNLVHIVDYEDTIEVFPASFPDGTIINWRWPYRLPVGAGVWGYMHVAYGNYDGGAPDTPVVPRQVIDISNWTEIIDFSLKGDRDGHNILHEFYLTAVSGDASTKLFEIGLLLHTSERDIDFVASSSLIGTYIDPQKRAWYAYNAGLNPMGVTYIVFAPHEKADVTGAFDLRSLLRYLVEQRLITGTEFVNGSALGVEPHSGAGSMRIKTWQTTFS